MKSLLVASVAVAVLSSCRGADPNPSSQQRSVEPDLSSEIERAEQRSAKPGCERPITVYEGSVTVNASDYVHPVAHGDDYVVEPINGLDRVISRSARVRFTLDYPFDEPFVGVVTGEITLRRTIDAIRAGFRTMYEGTTERDIPGMANKDVRGPYGRAFHVIDDLVIEGIDLCADDSFEITIGS